MSDRPVELADIVRHHGDEFLATHAAALSPAQKRVLRDVARCRTAALGGHVLGCDRCEHRQVAYNSCRNRHCPKCQGAARVEWTAAREAELLPVPYFHVVFTLPAEVAPLALQNPQVVYGLLFRAAAETLQEVAADPKHLGAQIGCLAVLHTWGQNLMHHPHVHCVVPAGGLSPDGTDWIPCRRGRKSGKLFFLPVRVLSRVFRGKFLHHLKRAFRDGELSFHGRLRPLSDKAEFERLLSASARQEWVVYAKRPFGSPQAVLRYLARYTHRVAIANSRLVDLAEGQVRFRWKDYADGGTSKVMALDAMEFLRRFLQHVLPGGFVRIRYYGFLSNRCRRENLALCRMLLGAQAEQQPRPLTAGEDLVRADEPMERCPACAVGRLLVVETFRPECPVPHPPRPHLLSRACAFRRLDSS